MTSISGVLIMESIELLKRSSLYTRFTDRM